MSKELKDYLHLYLGCEVEVQPSGMEYVFDAHTNIAVLRGIHFNDVFLEFNKDGDTSVDLGMEDIKPILRPLSDMTEEEFLEGVKIHTTAGGRVQITIGEIKSQGIQPMRPEVFRWALSHQFDLFGLIESGLAIDKSTLK